MNSKSIEDLKERVSCTAVLEQAGFAVDKKESTARAIKYRRGDDIVIVIHARKGWFDPCSEAKGDVLSLIQHLGSLTFVEALDRAAELVGFAPTQLEWRRMTAVQKPKLALLDRWTARGKPWQGSATWRYLAEGRFLPAPILSAAVQQDRLREGPHGSMWAAHVDDSGRVTGWEERGPDWRGFSTGGTKVLFRLGRPDALRVCVTEAAIDAMSFAAVEGLRDDSLYLSTGGGWSPTTEAAIRNVCARPGAQLIAATDRNAQGDIFADRLRAIAAEIGCDWARRAPPANDWNDALKAMMEGRKAQKRAGRGI